MALPASLASLTTREAIQDTLYRCVGSFDAQDATLFESAFVADAVFDLDGNVMEGLPAIRSGCFDAVSKLDTTHFITNLRTDVQDDASTARLSASALAYHWRPGQGKDPEATRFTSGSFYDIDVVKDAQAGLWKIKNWRMKIVWTEGDFGVMTGN